MKMLRCEEDVLFGVFVFFLFGQRGGLDMWPCSGVIKVARGRFLRFLLRHFCCKIFMGNS